MKYKQWVKTVPDAIANDPLWKMKAYRYALFLSDMAWKDVSCLSKNKLLLSLSDQLYRAAGSIGANISEGYSRRSKLDQARFYEYALGSARETRGWYFNARHTLEKDIFDSRILLITEIIKMLLYIVPETREDKIKEPTANYEVNSPIEIESYKFEPLK